MAEKRWDVFISYKRESDQSDANMLCDALEKAGVKCWIAPRDVAVTQQAITRTGAMARAGYDDAIPFAIEKSRAIVVMVSSGAMTSDHIKNEINLAQDEGIPFFTVRVEDVPLTGSFKYHLERYQWEDCFDRSNSRRFQRVVNRVTSLVGHATTELDEETGNTELEQRAVGPRGSQVRQKFRKGRSAQTVDEQHSFTSAPQDTQATYIDTSEQSPMVGRRSWPGASDQVIETINRVLGAAAERFDGLSVTNSKNYGAFQWRGIQNQNGLVLPSKGAVLPDGYQAATIARMGQSAQ